jgi:hypothetical protein
MKLKTGKECRIYGENGQSRGVSAKNLRRPTSKKFRWLAVVIDFIFTPQTHQIKIHKPTK